jgi:hypothetical protein
MTQTNITDEASTLLAQFQQLAELETDRCRIFPNGDVVVLLSEDLQLVYDVDCTPSFSAAEQALLQASIQEAIASHGWLYQVGNAVTGECHAQVLKPIDYKSFSGQHNEPAIALLSAYLLALQAEQAAA